MRRRLSLRGAATVCALVLAYAGSTAAQSAREIRAGVETEKTNARLFGALVAGDADAVAGLYTADAILMPPGGKTIRGAAGVRDYWAAGIKRAKTLRVESRRLAFQLRGDLAYDAGTYSLAYKVAGQENTLLDEGKYLIIWKRQRDGRWRLHVDIWNSDAAG